MTARVLIVDDMLANLKLLEARLVAEYFEVRTASNGAEALELCDRDLPDVILLDVMMPGMDGFEVCRRLKADLRTQHIPVVMVTALDHPNDLLKGLEAGADDFLTKPVNDLALITRVKNLARLKLLTDEMLMRASTEEQMGFAAAMGGEVVEAGRSGRILLVEDREGAAARMVDALKADNDVVHLTDPAEALLGAPDGNYDLLIVSLNLQNADGLRLCSQLRSLDRTRHLPIMIVVEPGEEDRLHRGLDMGVNDYIVRPVSTSELLARVRTQVKRKRYTDFLRSRLEQTVEMAVLDPLTALHNRRYLSNHLDTLFQESADRGRALSVLLIDVDHFKAINDTHGHDAGDDVLRELALRLRRNIRGIDLACRLGGEEFVVVMPDTSLDSAYLVGERLRQCIAAAPFIVGAHDRPISVTASMGVAALEYETDTPDLIMKRADQALYCAKRDGRNRVVADAA
ncbi:diguanylate cyclase response regulator [Methyloceanibacter methanicus]|uniref:diguanylate cyclase n=1 Tax=Methyloceanibacter methanicus TaxID=1774968 RepID=A0A1E3VYR4_9HYPH|nr:PleD family two-component system response regulator [Methyloceanibacter methanicus]ODR98684.1 diguanylate cyclase response regulator [Methyloceanibacter methanicus]